jgi:CarD family transcriptional regulator
MFLKYISTPSKPNPERRVPITITQGDRIHHPHHGIGKVQSIRRRSFSGEKGARFAEIFFKRERITLMLRENSLDDTIRTPIGPSRAEKLLDHMKTWKVKVSNQWKTRANAHQALMDEGEPIAYAEVYKSLREREQEEALSLADRKHLRRCTEFLSEELANALGQTTGETLDQMTQATRI